MNSPENKPESAAAAKSGARRNALLDQLRKDYAVFRDCQPLAVGIHKTIRERLPEVVVAELRTALRIHTNSTPYLKALLTTEQRFDLDGQPVGEVSAEQREVASNDLRERFKKNAERHRASQAAQKAQEAADKAAREHQEKLLKLAAKFNQR